MAIWNSDNVVLTATGSEILSKVKAGIGSITVSRVVTGAGFVSPSLLYKQTEVTKIKQEVIIQSVTTRLEGSTMDLRFNNDSLTESYSLYQIGVYVTHPDYVGEKLYLIAQCDTNSPDTIPLPTVTPASFSYSLFMVHSGTSQINISVNSAGSVSTEVFDSLRQEFITHKENSEIHVTKEKMDNISLAVQEFVNHNNSTEIHTTPIEKAEWSTGYTNSVDSKNKIESLIIPDINDLKSRVVRLEDGLFNNITGNPFLVSFDSLMGIKISKGVWNSSQQRIEC